MPQQLLTCHTQSSLVLASNARFQDSRSPRRFGIPPHCGAPLLCECTPSNGNRIYYRVQYILSTRARTMIPQRRLRLFPLTSSRSCRERHRAVHLLPSHHCESYWVRTEYSVTKTGRHPQTVEREFLLEAFHAGEHPGAKCSGYLRGAVSPAVDCCSSLLHTRTCVPHCDFFPNQDKDLQCFPRV